MSWKKYADKGGCDMDKNIFEVITGCGVNEAVNNILFKNEEYQKIQAEIDGLTDEFDKINLSKEQRLTVDRIISAYNANGALYGRMTYQQGMRDCASLLVEMGLIKDGKEEGIT